MLLYEDHGSPVYALAFSSDGAALASGARDGTVSVRRIDGSRHSLGGAGLLGKSIHALSFQPEASTLAVGGTDGWSVYGEGPPGLWGLVYRGGLMPATDVAFLDRSTLAVGLGDRFGPTAGRLELWDVPGKRRIDPAVHESSGVRSLSVCHRKGIVAWATGRREVGVWYIHKQDPTKFRLALDCQGVALSHDGRTLAAAADWKVFLYDLEKAQERMVLKGHKGQVSALAFSPDGTTLATGSGDRTVRLWDAATGLTKETFDWPIGKVYRLAYAPDGLRLAAGGDGGAVVVWDVE